MTEMLPSELPPALLPLSWLIGDWVGVGLGSYPSAPHDFRFGQEISFVYDGRPLLTYSSFSWIIDDDGNKVRPAATELGFWRPGPDNSVEVMIAHSIGYLETYLGTVEVTAISGTEITGARCELRTDIVARSMTAKDYSGGVRLYGLIGGDLGWTYDMSAVGQPHTNHLSARLSKNS